MRIKRQTEKGFMGAVVSFAKLHGWTPYHTHDSRRSDAGFPDLVLVRSGQLVFAELKAGRNEPSKAQTTWLGLLATVPGVTVRLWYPKDWAEIERVLGARR